MVPHIMADAYGAWRILCPPSNLSDPGRGRFDFPLNPASLTFQMYHLLSMIGDRPEEE